MIAWVQYPGAEIPRAKIPGAGIWSGVILQRTKIVSDGGDSDDHLDHENELPETNG